LFDTEYEGTTLYRLSESLIIQALRLKVDQLTNITTGIFGAYSSTELGTIRPTSVVIEDTTSGEVPKPFPTVSRGLTKGSVGDGRGISEGIQLGQSCSCHLA
jgi:hypothetical protein